jgi:hypothetical protein
MYQSCFKSQDKIAIKLPKKAKRLAKTNSMPFEQIKQKKCESNFKMVRAEAVGIEQKLEDRCN